MKNEIILDILNYKIEDFLESDYIKELIELESKDKIDCYFDCDGVLFDTIKVAQDDINEGLRKQREIDIKNNSLKDEDFYFVDLSSISYRKEVVDYFANVNWISLMERAGEIDNSCLKLKVIKNSNVFKNTSIATHRHTYLNEGIAKDKIFKEKVGNITIYSIPVKIQKSVAVPATNSIVDDNNYILTTTNILVDDNYEKINEWVLAGGIGVLFNPKFQGLELPTLERPYFITNNILDVFKVAYLKYYFEKTKPFIKRLKSL